MSVPVTGGHGAPQSNTPAPTHGASSGGHGAAHGSHGTAHGSHGSSRSKWQWLLLAIPLILILVFLFYPSTVKEKSKNTETVEAPKKEPGKARSDSDRTLHTGGGIHITQTVDIDGEHYSSSIPSEVEYVDEDNE